MEWDLVLRMSWGDLQRRIFGYSIRDDKAWQKARAIVTMVHNRGIKKGQQKKPEQLMPLAIDRAHRPKMTEDKKKEVKKAIKAWGLKDATKKDNSLDKGQNRP